MKTCYQSSYTFNVQVKDDIDGDHYQDSHEGSVGHTQQSFSRTEERGEHTLCISTVGTIIVTRICPGRRIEGVTATV